MAPSRTPSVSTPTVTSLSSILTVDPGRSASPTEDTPPGSGTSTPVPGGDGLKIDIPSTPSSASKGAKK